MPTPPLLHISHNLLPQMPTLRHPHLLRKRSRRLPPRRSPRRSLLKHLIDLLERQPLRFRNQKVRVDARDAAETSPVAVSVRCEFRGLGRFLEGELNLPDEEDFWPEVAVLLAYEVGRYYR